MLKNDAERIMATQVAYLDSTGSTGAPQNVGELVDSILETYGTFDSKTGTYIMNDDVSGSNKAQFEVAKGMFDKAEQNNTYSWRNWNIVDVRDNNTHFGNSNANIENSTHSGFYGCVIDTNDGDAVIACRGSEGNSIADWGLADAGRLNNEMTWQQYDAKEYMEYIENNPALNNYNGYDLDGHSLGGSLATVMAIESSSDFKSRILSVDSLDGPGFSTEFLAKHKEAILELKGKLHHYQWSFVGSILLQPLYCEDIVVSAHDADGIAGSFVRHSPTNVILDENGNVISGSREFMQYVGIFVTIYDILSDILGHERAMLFIPALGTIILWCFDGIAVKAAEMINDAVDKEIAKIREYTNGIVKNMMSRAVSGDYEISVRYITECAENLLDAAKEMDKIKDDIDRIRKDLPYLSIAGNAFRAALFSQTAAMEVTMLGIKSLGKVTERAAIKYNKTDQSVASHF